MKPTNQNQNQNVKKITPAPATPATPAVVQSDATTSAAEPQKPKKAKLAPAFAAAVKVGKAVNRVASHEGRYGSYAEPVKKALESARRWLETAKVELEKLGPDFQPARQARQSGGQIEIDSVVTLREKRRELYAGLILGDELTKGITVASLHGAMVAVRTSKGTIFVPRAHLKMVEPAAS